MSDTDLTSENPVLTPHDLQILQGMLQSASEGLLTLSSLAPVRPKAPEGISGESHV